VVREVRCVFSRHLKIANVLDSLIVAGNSFQMVGAEKLKERLLKLVVREGIHKRFWLAERWQCDGWYTTSSIVYATLFYFGLTCQLFAVFAD